MPEPFAELWPCVDCGHQHYARLALGSSQPLSQSSRVARVTLNEHTVIRLGQATDFGIRSSTPRHAVINPLIDV